MYTLNLSCAALLLAASAASGALYQQDFEVDDSLNWNKYSGPATVDSAANYFFDYSTVGIPAAPNGAGTKGLKLQANLSSGVFGGMSVSPILSTALPEVYTLSFDFWSNSVGAFPAGGSGSTNLSTFGVGTAGGTAQWPGGVQDSVWFATTGEGGSGSDYRAYSTAAPTSYTDTSTVYAAPNGAVAADFSRNNTNTYYGTFGNVTPPAAQTALYPNQTGSTAVGTMAFEWHRVQIDKTAANVTWTIDGVLFATVDASTVTFGGTNIFFGHSDINAGSSGDANDAALLFTLIDNVQVVPEPSVTLLAMGALLIPFRRRRR